jgi:hypothetical protein
MGAVRDLWTDERLDDLNGRIDRGFEGAQAEFRALRLEMRTEFVAVRGEMQNEFGAVRSEIQSEFAAVRAEAAATHRTTMQIILGGFGLMLVGFAGTIATIVTQV